MRDRQGLSQAAESSHIDHVTHGVHYRSGRQEQYRFKECVGKHVEHCEGDSERCKLFTSGSRSQRHEHVTELADG